VVVLLATLLVAFIGMTGLGVDYAFSTLERRILQNGVDAAASSGAIDLAEGTSPEADVTAVVTRNGARASTTVVCEYVDNTNTVTGLCSAVPSGTTGGVRVTATSTRPTYFMRVLEVPTATVSATATARVLSLSASSPYPSSASLFVVCAIDTKMPGAGNPTMSILLNTGGQWVPNPAADGVEFIIHAPQVADCGMQGNSFKGLKAVGALAGPITQPYNIITETGTRAGPVTQAVRGIAGCGTGASSDNIDNCMMIIPAFVSSPSMTVAYAVRWMAFEVRQVNANIHYGRLRLNYTVSQESYTLTAPWTKNAKQVLTMVRLWN
jgi:hypothetical protein